MTTSDTSTPSEPSTTSDTSTPSDTSQIRLDSLTGMRALLAAGVFLAHALSGLTLYDVDGVNALGYLVPIGHFSVTSFFVLSGFVLTWSAPPGDTEKRFWRRRAARILPNHVFTFTLILVFAAIGLESFLAVPVELKKALANLFLVHAWVPDMDYWISFNAPTWSISVDVLCYLLFPFLLKPMKSIRPDRLWRWSIGVGLAIVTVPAIVSFLVRTPPDPSLPIPIHTTEIWLVWFFPPVRLLEFLLGILLARLIQTGRWRRPARWLVGLSVLVAWFAMMGLPALGATAYFFCAILAIPAALVIGNMASRDLEGRSSRLHRPAMLALGEAAYSLYLLHFPLFMVAKFLLGTDRQFGAVTATSIILALLVVTEFASLALYRYLERPMSARFKLSRRDRAQRNPATLSDAVAPAGPSTATTPT
jgi:peptidoglycan/LPS O-acetylase OafA/YrhL